MTDALARGFMTTGAYMYMLWARRKEYLYSDSVLPASADATFRQRSFYLYQP